MSTPENPVPPGSPLLARIAGYVVCCAASLLVGVTGTHVATVGNHGDRITRLEERSDATWQDVKEIKARTWEILQELRGRKN